MTYKKLRIKIATIMNKFFVPKNKIINNVAIIEGEDVKHIYKVLRLNIGEKVNINNLEGQEYIGEIKEINKKYVKVNIIKNVDINNESPINITLFQGLPKSSKMDFIVQKNTEIGIKRITPIITKRVVVKINSSEFKKSDRWNKIALESSKQSKRTIIPIVDKPIEYEEFLKQLKMYDLIIVPYENADNFGIKALKESLKGKQIKSAAIIIGPEGGFEEEEINELKEKGAYIVTLGPRILRTETAGLVCTTLVMYELGDLGGIY